jgi:hypothetical protein
MDFVLTKECVVKRHVTYTHRYIFIHARMFILCFIFAQDDKKSAGPRGRANDKKTKA